MTRNNIHLLATALGATRVALGIGYLLAPKSLSRASFGSGVDSPELRFTNTVLGSREILLGTVTLGAARETHGVLGRLLLGGALADAWDAYSILATRGTSAYAKAMVSAVALTASALGAYAGTAALTASR